MRIFYAALKYDYARREQGYSFEHYNFYDSLVRMGHDIIYFDVATMVREHGRDSANQLLVDIVKRERPEVLFSVLFRNDLEARALREVSENTDTTTIGWFSDDHWRFESYSRLWAPLFNWVVTTSSGALAKYRLSGFEHVIKSQWACNTFTYKPANLATRFPVSFVGLPHGNRRYVVQALRDAGIDIHTFGKGWDSGRVTQAEMIQIFNASCINLNMANASARSTTLGRWLALLLQVLATSPLPSGARVKGIRRLSSVDRALHGAHPAAFPEQIKGRNFEVPGCGGFLLTPPAENLDDYYVPGVEVGHYRDTAELISQVRRFLADPGLRRSIAAAGYQRTLREHTWVHRFAHIFQHAGLESSAVDAVLTGRVTPGHTREVR